jgi:hypothetical protein
MTDSLMRTFDEIHPNNTWDESYKQMNLREHALIIRRALYGTRVAEQTYPTPPDCGAH